MLSRFFIDRPIFATVISMAIVLAGALSFNNLPISQFPPVTPPTIQVDCNYPGASSDVVSKTIAAPIEQRVNGVENMLYMSSQSTSDGSYTLTITFETGTNLNIAQVRVQNRVDLAMPELPEVVRATGVTARKRSPELLLTFALSSPGDKLDQLYLSNYAVLHIKEVLSRVPGVSDVTVFGQRDYSMRIWVNPDRLEARNLTVIDVINAIKKQNIEVALGKLGPEANAGAGDSTQYMLTTQGRLEDPEKFKQIIVASGPEGQLIRLRDVAEVDLGAKSNDIVNRFDKKQTVGLAIFLLPDANALESSKLLKQKMAELAAEFSDEITYEIGYDTTPYIESSINEVFKAMRDSVILVAIVVLIFLQTWRSALIPLATVPVAIIGTMAAMLVVGHALGDVSLFGRNNLTLFGLVLAVGIVVDDAIVVVEAVQQQIDKGFMPREATLRAMEEVTGPVIAVGAVLTAVFIPCMFFPGLVGLFFRQFALTIAIATIISTFNSLTLCPALATILLKPKQARPDIPTRVLNFLFGWFFRIFNWSFHHGSLAYRWSVRRLIRLSAFVLIGYGIVCYVAFDGYFRLPMGFIPAQDKGYMICSIQLPDAASAERTRAIVDELATTAMNVEIEVRANHDEEGAYQGVLDGKKDGKVEWLKKVKPIKHCNAVAGNSFMLSAYGSNFGSMFIILDTFDARRDPRLYVDRVIEKLTADINREIPGAIINVAPAPAVPGLGRSGGLTMMIQDKSEAGLRSLQERTDEVIKNASRIPSIVRPFSVFRNSTPQVLLRVNEAECVASGVDALEVYATMQATLGQRYVNDYNQFGRTWQVNVQADPRFRNSQEDIAKLKVRNRNGDLIPLGVLTEDIPATGPAVISRYNTYPAAAIRASVAPRASSGETIQAMEQLARETLPVQMGYEWTELTFLERRSRDTGMNVFYLAVFVVILVLAALYESWALPFAVVLVVPMCVVSSLVGVWMTNWDSVVSSDFTIHAFRRDINVVTWLGFMHEGISGVVTVARGGEFTLTPLGVNVTSVLAMKKQDVNIFTQVGFVVLIGLACKNAILIVEYAKWQVEAGMDRVEAVLAACQQRLRPILMTSFAFILGVIPLAFATGAGSEMRRALGLAVLAGMIGVTVFGIFLTPIFFVLIERLINTHLFRTDTMRVIGIVLRFILALLTLGIVYLVLFLLARVVKRKK